MTEIHVVRVCLDGAIEIFVDLGDSWHTFDIDPEQARDLRDALDEALREDEALRGVDA